MPRVAVIGRGSLAECIAKSLKESPGIALVENREVTSQSLLHHYAGALTPPREEKWKGTGKRRKPFQK